MEVLRRALPAHIRSALNDLPKTLDETYERALQMIDEDMREDAQRLFQCLAVSIRPLRVEELAEILAFRFDAGALPKFNPDWRVGGNAEEAVLSVCSNLVTVVDIGGSLVVQFSHFSVKEFLASDRLATLREDLSSYRIVSRSAHTILAQASISVLLELDNYVDKDITIKKFPLSIYAAEHWVDHGQFENVSSSIQVATEQLFNPDRPYFSAWVWIYDMDDPWRGNMPTKHPERPQATPLYYAVLCGFRDLIEHLIATYPRDIDARGGYYGSPLLAALIKEDIDTASSLLQRGADVNALGERGMSPLHRSSQGGRIDIVRFLLDHNADVNLRDTRGDTPLGLASFEGELEVSRRLLERGANVNSQDEEGFSPLHGAAQNGHLDVVRFLIESGADIGSPNKEGRTPLYSASRSGHVKMAELLIRHGADVHSRENDGWTPLHSASQEGHIKMVELLILQGADVGCRENDGWTPLHLASQEGHVDMAELLLKHGGAGVVSSCKNDGWTPLHSASQEGHVKLAELLILHGANVGSRDNNGWTPLHSASQEGRVKLAELLLYHGADVDSRENDGWTPLHSASEEGHVKLVELLLIQHRAQVDSRDNKAQTSLHLAALKGHLDIAKILLACGADPNVRNDIDKTPSDLALDNAKLEVANFLSRFTTMSGATKTTASPTNNQHPDFVQFPRRPHHGDGVISDSVYTASANGQIDIVRSLLDNCAADIDVEDRNNHRQTALDAASDNGKLDVAELLIERGADVNSRCAAGRTPLHYASRGGHLDVVRLLLDHKADVDARERNGMTALAFASCYGHFEIVKLLLEHGANANVQNSYGRTPRQEALAYGHGRIAKVLLEYDA